MDFYDIAKLVPFIDPAGYAACWVRRKRKSDIDELVADGVVKRKG